jgi:hypothetical protein
MFQCFEIKSCLSKGLGLGLPWTIKKTYTRIWNIEGRKWVDVKQQNLERRQRESYQDSTILFYLKKKNNWMKTDKERSM